jgi:EAL domain-containing protein (putative c-di-GMP-specific phosphodiesterase class I)
MEDRFRLVQQPIASLQGHDAGMADVLVRMLDPNGTEVLPSEFLPPAERNDLLKNIDRWVLSAALRQAANRGTGCLFVRLSGDSVVDATLLPWLDAQIQAIQVDPATLCIQITEEVALRHLQEVRRLATALRERRLRVALEHLGVAEGAASLLDQVPADFAKIDGSLMQGLKENRAAQDRIAELAAAAQERNIPTIAERVEDANTMAILWQLGIHHVQGFFLQQPEDVVLADG